VPCAPLQTAGPKRNALTCGTATLKGSTRITECHQPEAAIIFSDDNDDNRPDPIPAELAPFLAQAKIRLEEATEGLQPHEAIQHLESTLAQTEMEASRLGIQFEVADAIQAQMGTGGDGDGPVVVIQQIQESPDA
jgi:hypothetical protein